MQWLDLCHPGNAVPLSLLSGQSPGLACIFSAGSGICVSWLWEAFWDLGLLAVQGTALGTEDWGQWKITFWDGLRDITQLGFLSREAYRWVTCPFQSLPGMKFPPDLHSGVSAGPHLRLTSLSFPPQRQAGQYGSSL